MSIQDNIFKVIANEIQNDPENLGYKNKTNQEIATLLNNPYKKEIITTITCPARFNQIAIGIANVPNVISEVDIITAKNYIIANKIIQK